MASRVCLSPSGFCETRAVAALQISSPWDVAAIKMSTLLLFSIETHLSISRGLGLCFRPYLGVPTDRKSVV